MVHMQTKLRRFRLTHHRFEQRYRQRIEALVIRTFSVYTASKFTWKWSAPAIRLSQKRTNSEATAKHIKKYKSEHFASRYTPTCITTREIDTIVNCVLGPCLSWDSRKVSSLHTLDFEPCISWTLALNTCWHVWCIWKLKMLQTEVLIDIAFITS